VFDRFYSAFEKVPAGQSVRAPFRDPRLVPSSGYVDLVEQSAGCSFNNGIYRLHDEESGTRSIAMISDAFSDYAQRACPFGYDWLGRQFALDSSRVENGESLVLLMEPGTAEVLEIPLSFAAFHEQLESLKEPALAGSFFADWSRANPLSIPLNFDACVGYRIPLFLGGSDTIENLVVIDLEVYWSLCGQLRSGTRRLPPGMSISEISIND